jgi:hypothetical protein
MPDGRADKLRRLGAGRSNKRRSQRLKAIRPDIGSWKKRNLGELSSKTAACLDYQLKMVSAGPVEKIVVLANSDLADTVGVAHFPSIPVDSRVIGVARVHNVCLPHSSGVAA